MAHKNKFSKSLYDSIFAVGMNFLSQGQYEKALIIFDGLIALFPHEVSAQVAYGEALLLSGKYEQAGEHFMGLKNDVLVGRVLLGAARSLVMLGKHYEAKRTLLPIIEGEIEVTQIEMALAKSIFFAAFPNENPRGFTEN